MRRAQCSWKLCDLSRSSGSYPLDFERLRVGRVLRLKSLADHQNSGQGPALESLNHSRSGSLDLRD